MKKSLRKVISVLSAAAICVSTMGGGFVRAAENDKAEYYEVILKECEHGRLSLDREEALYQKGERVEITVKSEKGYYLDSIKAEGDQKEAVLLIEDEGERLGYTFTMPQHGVELSASFKKIEQTEEKEQIKGTEPNKETEKVKETQKAGGMDQVKELDGRETEQVKEKETVKEPEQIQVSQKAGDIGQGQETGSTKNTEDTKETEKAKEPKQFQKTFSVATTGGVLRILDGDGKLITELKKGQEKTFTFSEGSKTQAEVFVEAKADEGYTVESYVTYWFADDTGFEVPGSLHDIDKKTYERGHYLSTAEMDERFVVSFSDLSSGKSIEKNAKPAARAAADPDNPKKGDTFTGNATVYYNGAADKTYNGTGYISCTSGEYKGEDITMQTCASGHSFAAPRTGQTGIYTITITKVDADKGIVEGSVYWKNDAGTSGYQDLSGTFSYKYNPEGQLYIQKGISGSLDGFIRLNGDVPDLSATFGIYSDEACKDKDLVKKVKTDKNGDMVKEGIELTAGVYYVKELIPPKGFALNENVKKAKVGSGSSKSVIINDRPIRAKVNGKKIDAATGTSIPTNGLSLEGALYGVFADAGCTKQIADGITDKDGNMNFTNPYFLIGTYYIKELRPPQGYESDPEVHKIVVDEKNGYYEGSTYRLKDINFTSEEQPTTGWAKLKKVSANPAITDGNSCYSYEGATFKITNALTGQEIEERMVTKDNGESQTIELPVGKYVVIEEKAPKGFILSTREYEVHVESKKTSVLIIENEPTNDPVTLLLEKIDKETGKVIPTGKGEFTDAEYTFKYYDGQYQEIVDFVGITPTRQWVLATNNQGKIIFQDAKKISGDDFYTNRNGIKTLPLGTVTIQETKPPKGYKADPSIYILNIEADSEGKLIKSYQAPISPEPIMRGDLKGMKVSNGDLKRMANVPFKITSVTTGESHTVLTDENGMFDTSSAWNPHSQNTNRGESSEDGVWFGNLEALDENAGALPYDTYRVEELPCEANKDKVLLEPFEVKIFRDMATVDLGTLTNDYTEVPQIGTTATDQETGGHMGYISPITTIKDVVEYAGLTSGKEYVLQGILMDKSTGKELLVDGKPVTAKTTFKPVNSEGSVDVIFTFASTALAGKAVVAFEYLQLDGVEVAAHADINDEGQTVTFEKPQIGTTAIDQGTGGHTGHISEATTIIDTVEYKGLFPGKEYVLQGTLMDKSTGKELLVDGKPVTAQRVFKPERTSGSVDMKFTFDSTALAGKAVVAFEHLRLNGVEVAVHADINDEGQTVTFRTVNISTTAVDQETGGHTGHVSETTTIEDTVTYSGLIPGKEYSIKGVLMNKSTGKKLKVGGKDITAEKAFKPQKADGSVKIEFTFDSSALAGKAVVVFEYLHQDGMEIAVHADLKDNGQTVTFEDVKIGTRASEKDTGKKEVTAAKKVTIVDSVTYRGLIAGEKYTMKGVLMDKETGRELLIGGQTIRVEKTFKPEKSKGSVKMEFTIDASALKGKAVVVFEEVFFNGRKIAAHADIKDAAQTVKFMETEKPKTPTQMKTPVNPPKTGDNTNILMYGLLLAGAGTIIVVNVHKKKRRGQKGNTDS